MATFSERLKELRKEKKTTLVVLAEYVGVSRSALSRYERGQADANSETLKKLAEYFNVSVDYLVGKVDF